MDQLDRLGRGGLPPDGVHRGNPENRMIREIEELLKTANARELEIVREFVRALVRK